MQLDVFDQSPGSACLPCSNTYKTVCLGIVKRHSKSICLVPDVEEEVLAIQQAAAAVLQQDATDADWIQYMQVSV